MHVLVHALRLANDQQVVERLNRGVAGGNDRPAIALNGDDQKRRRRLQAHGEIAQPLKRDRRVGVHEKAQQLHLAAEEARRLLGAGRFD